MSDAGDTAFVTPLVALSTAVFVERDGRILILKRAVGAAVGSWYLPGGAFDPGETIEECARRELFEECGLTPEGPLTCVGVAQMHVYGQDSLQVLYRCACPTGEVVLSNEHSGARWIDPLAYRDRYFSDEIIDRLAAASKPGGAMVRNIRSAIDAYLEWRRMADGLAALA